MSFIERLPPRVSVATLLASTRVRILGWYVLLLVLAIALGLFIQREFLLRQLDSEVNAQLSQEVRELEQLSTGRDPNTGEPFGDDVAAIFNTFLSRNIPVEDEALFTLVEGKPHAATVAEVQLLAEPDVVAVWAGITETMRREIDTSAGRVRYVAVPVKSSDGEIRGTFIVASFLESRRDGIDEVIRNGAIVFGLTMIGASVAAWFAAGRILRPVSLLTETARDITDEHWSERIPVQGNDEIAELTRTFNDMLDRLETAFQTQRRFIDDAGHELRTPITIIRGHLELWQSEASGLDDETMHLVMDELDRMSRMVDELLLLAKTEHRDFLDLHPLDVAELTREIAAKASAMGERKWMTDQAADVVLVADRQRLTQAVMNLVRNAIEHTEEGAEISVGSRAFGPDVHIWVRDAGEGIPVREQQRIFGRFSRGHIGRRTTDGAGLGLAIVEAIVKAHGGRVTVDSALGVGSTFTLILPASGPAKEPA